MEQPEQSWNKVGGSIVKLCGIIKTFQTKLWDLTILCLRRVHMLASYEFVLTLIDNLMTTR